MNVNSGMRTYTIESAMTRNGEPMSIFKPPPSGPMT